MFIKLITPSAFFVLDVAESYNPEAVSEIKGAITTSPGPVVIFGERQDVIDIFLRDAISSKWLTSSGHNPVLRLVLRDRNSPKQTLADAISTHSESISPIPFEGTIAELGKRLEALLASPNSERKTIFLIENLHLLFKEGSEYETFEAMSYFNRLSQQSNVIFVVSLPEPEIGRLTEFEGFEHSSPMDSRLRFSEIALKPKQESKLRSAPVPILIQQPASDLSINRLRTWLAGSVTLNAFLVLGFFLFGIATKNSAPNLADRQVAPQSSNVTPPTPLLPVRGLDADSQLAVEEVDQAKRDSQPRETKTSAR